MKIKIAPIQTIILLSALFILLLIAHVTVVFNGSHFDLSSSDFLSKLFNLDEEKNIPTIYSSVLMAFAGILCLFISLNKKENRYEYRRWVFLFFLMIFLGADETLQIHERVTDVLRSIHSFEGIFYFAWVIPYAIATVLLFLYLFKFIFSLPSKTKVLLLISGFLFVTGAVGFELLAAKIFSDTSGIKTLQFKILSTVEETLEFSGLLLLSFTLLDYLKNVIKVPDIKFNFERIEYSKDSINKSIELMEIPRERISKSKNLIIISISLAVFIVAIFQIEGAIFDIPFKNFSRDILQTFDSHYYIGAISQLGLFLWASSAAILFFTAFIIRLSKDRSMFNYIFFFGLLTLVLLLDDAFLLHEQLFRITFNMPEKVTQLLYIISAVAIFYFNRKSLLKTNLPIIVAALVVIVLSIIADKNSDLLGSVSHLFEDGLKFIGIILWFTYSAETCYSLLKNNNS